MEIPETSNNVLCCTPSLVLYTAYDDGEISLLLQHNRIATLIVFGVRPHTLH